MTSIKKDRQQTLKILDNVVRRIEAFEYGDAADVEREQRYTQNLISRPQWLQESAADMYATVERLAIELQRAVGDAFDASVSPKVIQRRREKIAFRQCYVNAFNILGHVKTV